MTTKKSQKENFMFCAKVRLALCLVLTWGAISLMVPQSANATTSCNYNFSSGIGNSRLIFCVTVNGNIAQIETSPGQWISSGGEGYGICDQNAPQNYTDYGVSDTGNWGSPTLVSHTSSSVTIARSTGDGKWTLTQTITKVPTTSSIKVSMAVKNNQSVSDTVYLVRFANAYLTTANNNGYEGWTETQNSAFVWTDNNFYTTVNYGLMLQNVGNPPFGFWQGYAQTVPTGPNACAFAFNDSGGAYYGGGGFGPAGSIEVAYVNNIAPGQTLTANLTYRGF